MTNTVTKDCSWSNVSVASLKWTGGECISFRSGVMMFMLFNLAAAFCDRFCR